MLVGFGRFWGWVSFCGDLLGWSFFWGVSAFLWWSGVFWTESLMVDVLWKEIEVSSRKQIQPKQKTGLLLSW